MIRISFSFNGESYEKTLYSFQNECNSFLLFLFFGLFWTTQFWSNYWEFSSWVGNLIWIRNIISLLFICLMIWILVRSGHAYLFRIPRKKWLSYSVLTVLAAVVLICFNYLTAKHVQGTNEGWNLFIAYSETKFCGVWCLPNLNRTRASDGRIGM